MVMGLQNFQIDFSDNGIGGYSVQSFSLIILNVIYVQFHFSALIAAGFI